MRRGVRQAVHQAASLLLSYPGDDWPDRLALVRDALGPLRAEPARLLGGFCAEAAALDPIAAAADYVTTFDRSGRRTLHLTYYSDGDTRRRGQSLLEIKSVYRAHGWQPEGRELPDFLPLMLEFAARVPRAGERLLRDHRPGLDLLLAGLMTARSRYCSVVEAVRMTLPAARRLPQISEVSGGVRS
ncbi:MAG: nitrate reductase molybdenum cofactor assembly chaperone [Nonomuraea sp.]|nr:nitrate reductase molybdenum cofactor assembly chaperone [Nonomuraea sp.]